VSKRNWLEVPHIVRNRQTRKWPTYAMRGGIVGAGVCCLGAIVLIPHPLFHLLTASAILFLGASLGCALFVLLSRPVHKIVLGDRMEIWPGRRRYPLSDIEQIEFRSGPEDDYEDATYGDETRKARIAVRSVYRTSSINLSLNPADAAKLIRWANEHEIRMSGAGTDRIS
jgi:hypothetical protein